jgi:hypothetical protein
MKFKAYNKYDVYEDGRIFSNNLKVFMSPFLDTQKRYLYIDLFIDGKKERWAIHRLVAKMFVPNPNNLNVVGHIDADTLNNNADNLKWITQKENIHQSYLDSGVDAVRNFNECYIVTSNGIIGEFKSIREATRNAVKLGAKFSMIAKHKYHKGMYIVEKV